MILGIGTDIVNVDRIVDIVQKNDSTFISRLFTEKEQSIIADIKKDFKKASFLAKRFAAKEAVSKAFGTGIGGYLAFKDIEILNNELGKPYVVENEALDRLTLKMFKQAQYSIHLSLSDEKHYAIAYCVIESR